MPVHLVTLAFDTEHVSPAAIETAGDETTLEGFLRRTMDDRAWDWTRTRGDALALETASHLLQRIDADPPYRVLCRYLFDGAHAAAHPEVLDAEHVNILHGTMAAKLIDEGVIVLEPDGIAASLRWVATERAGVHLRRDGGRIRPDRSG